MCKFLHLLLESPRYKMLLTKRETRRQSKRTVPMARWCAHAVVSFLAALLGQTSLPHAQPAAYPVRPITMVVPTSAGGAVDVLARLIGVHLGNVLGQSVVIDNRPGAGGNIGTASVARAAPDGHTIIFVSGTQLINQLATNPPPY